MSLALLRLIPTCDQIQTSPKTNSNILIGRCLAEMLFHFQGIDGIEKRIAEIQASSVEDTVGELEGAKFLYRSGVPFRFVVPTGKRGEDFDVQALGSNGNNINCEMKTKPADNKITTRR